MTQFIMTRVHPQLKHYFIAWYETKVPTSETEEISPVYKGSMTQWLREQNLEDRPQATFIVDSMEFWTWEDFAKALIAAGYSLDLVDVMHIPQSLVVSLRDI